MTLTTPNPDLKQFKKESIALLMKHDVLLKPEYLDQYNSLTTKEEITTYTNQILDENNITREEHSKKNIFQKKETGVEVLETYKEYVKKREISDFVQHYNNRFQALSGMLKNRDLKDLTSINLIKGMKDKEQVSTIGMIFEISESKNGHIILELEDKTGIIKAIVLKSNPELFSIAKNLVHDEVIAVSGMAGGDVMFVSEIIFPDIPLSNNLKCSPEEEYAVFISDIHIGSKVFYEEEFQKFLDWISNTRVPNQHKKIVPKIKYLIIGGDLIEGVGIFPGQEDELVATSVIDQYELFAKCMDKVPKDIEIIICPGNHDAVRLAEPQPPFNKKYLGRLADFENVTLISSPGLFNIGKKPHFEGFNILMYHGFSMPYYGDKIPEIRESGGLSNMNAIMKFYLQRRHFAPAHGSTQFIPDIRYDPLVIKKVPDILVTGHVHKLSVDNYRGVTIMNCSTWVAPSEYQQRFGLVPDCCRAVLINLHTRDIKVLNFESAEKQQANKEEKEKREHKKEEESKEETESNQNKENEQQQASEDKSQ